MPFYDPTYHGFTPFTSFTHFNPFLMPGAMNPLYAGFMGQQYLGTLPHIYPYGDGNLQNKNNVAGYGNDPEVRKLTKMDQKTLNLKGDMPQYL